MAELKKSEPISESVSKTVTETVKVEETPQAVEATSVKTTTSNVDQQPQPVKKGGFGWGKCCLAGCIVLVLCCICTVVFALVAPNLLVKTIIGGNRAPDASLTRLTSLTEFGKLEAIQLNGMDSFKTANDVTGDAQIVMNEKEIEVLILSMMGVNTAQGTATNENIQKVGVKITPGKAFLEMDLGLLAPLLASSPDMQNFDPKAFDGVNFSVTLSTSADNKSFVIDNFSTGNNIIDSLIPAQVKTSVLESVQKSIEDSLTGGQGSEVKINKIEFRQGELMLGLKASTSTL